MNAKTFLVEEIGVAILYSMVYDSKIPEILPLLQEPCPTLVNDFIQLNFPKIFRPGYLCACWWHIDISGIICIQNYWTSIG